MHSSLQLSDAFDQIVTQICLILNCDRASIFIVDWANNELLTKAAKNTGTIRIPLSVGIVGHVAKTGESLNILDAH